MSGGESLALPPCCKFPDCRHKFKCEERPRFCCKCGRAQFDDGNGAGGDSGTVHTPGDGNNAGR